MDDDRTGPRRADQARRGRALGVVAAAAGAAAVLLAALGMREATSAEAIVVDVEPATAATPPQTVPPLSTEPPPSTGSGTGSSAPSTAPPSTLAVAPPTEAGAPATSVPPSPDDPAGDAADVDGADPDPQLAELLGPQRSAIPVTVPAPPRPVAIDVSTLDMDDVPIRPIGIEPDGQLELPDETEIGWYRFGASAGQPGATVLAAHVAWNDTVGPFGGLGLVGPGDAVEVLLDDGRTRYYEVVERATYGKLELPRERIWRRSGPEELVLITCGGAFNPDVHRYAENIVVYAVPVG